MMRCRRFFQSFLSVLVVGLSIQMLWPAKSARHAQATSGRLEHVTQIGGVIRAVVLDGVDALIAEGNSIVRIPLVGPNAYQASERLLLGYGALLDLARTEQALYAVSSSHLIALTPDGRKVIQVVDGGGERLSVRNNYLVLSSKEAGVSVFFLRPDGQLFETNQLDSPSETAQATLLSSTLLVMADQAAGLRFINLENQAHPSPISTLSEMMPASGLAVFDQSLYVQVQHRLRLVDASQARSPRSLGHYAPLNNVQDLAWLDGFLLAADASDGIKVYELDAQGIARYRYSQLGPSALSMAVDAGQQLILSSQPNGISIFSAKNLPQLPFLSFIPLWETPISISIQPNGLALVALGTGGLAIIDISIPTAPQVLAALSFAGPVQHSLLHPVYPNILYVLQGDGRLLTLGFKRSEPEHIPVYADIPLAGTPQRMAIDEGGRMLVLANGRAGAQFFSLIAPTSPKTITSMPSLDLNTPGITQIQAAESETWLALDGGTWRLLGFDQQGVLQDYAQLANGGQHLARLPDQQVVVGGQNKMQILSLRNRYFSAVSSYSAFRNISHSQALVGQLVVSSLDGGLLILDTSNTAAPREQRFIPINGGVQRFLMAGDDFLLISPSQGLIHLRFPVLLADQSEMMPVVVGNYRPAYPVQALVPLAEGRWGILGRGWHQFDGTQSRLMNERLAVAASPYQDGVILLDKAGVYRLDGQQQVVAENSAIQGQALANDGERLWVLSAAQDLYTLDIQSLVSLSPAVSLSSLPTPQTLWYVMNQLLIGTQNGEIWLIDGAYQARRIAQNLGGAIHDIRPTPNGQLLVSAGKGGLWWLGYGGDAQEMRVVAHQKTPALAAVFHPSQAWVAVASESCGVQIFDVRQPEKGLFYFAAWQGGLVTEVAFREDEVLAVVDGGLNVLRFNPESPIDQAPMPYQPNPPHQAEIATDKLSWQAAKADCNHVRYEVWLNGKLAGTASTLEWSLPAVLQHDLEWQIVSVGAQGQRTLGPKWQVYAPLEAWAASPPVLQKKVMRVPNEAGETASIWRAMLVVFALFGGVGLATLVWRQLTRWL